MNDMVDIPRWITLLGLFAIGYMISDLLFGWF